MAGFFNNFEQHLPIAARSLKDFTRPALDNHFGLVEQLFAGTNKLAKPIRHKTLVQVEA